MKQRLARIGIAAGLGAAAIGVVAGVANASTPAAKSHPLVKPQHRHQPARGVPMIRCHNGGTPITMYNRIKGKQMVKFYAYLPGHPTTGTDIADLSYGIHYTACTPGPGSWALDADTLSGHFGVTTSIRAGHPAIRVLKGKSTDTKTWRYVKIIG